MKNRFIITISDVHGSKQYSLSDTLKKVIYFTVPTLVVIGVIAFFYIRFLVNEVSTFDNKIAKVKEKSELILKHNKELKSSNDKLEQLRKDSKDKLASMNKQLKEIESVVGVSSDVNLTNQIKLQTNNQGKDDVNKSINFALLEGLKKDKISAIQKAILLNSIPNGKPFKFRKISSGFGYRVHPITKRKSFHAGLDIPAKKGTAIYAPASGVVIYSKKKGMYGKYLLIAHAYGFKTAYGHLSKYKVKAGDFVTKGQIIAYVGNSGKSIGSHLHYEVRYLNKWLDPKIFIDWDLDNINYIRDRIRGVDWKTILSHIKKLISLSN